MHNPRIYIVLFILIAVPGIYIYLKPEAGLQ